MFLPAIAFPGASSIAAAIESPGMNLPYSISLLAQHSDKQTACNNVVKTIHMLLKQDTKPLDILTKSAFENAIALIMVLCGETNAVLDWLAIAKTPAVVAN